MSIAFASVATAIVQPMELDDLIEWRKERMKALADRHGGNAKLGRLLGYRDGAFIGQMIGGHRPITEKTIAAASALPGFSNWFTADQKTDTPINLTNNPEYPSIRRVRFRLSAGASGFAVEYDGEDTSPIVFQRKWFDGHSYTPGKLFAARVANGSMEPGLYHDDTVVVNTADTTLKDGEVFAMNYEGELVIKRLIRDAGQWWLASDNPDQRRYPRKVCSDNVFCVGRIVHKQSEKI